METSCPPPNPREFCHTAIGPWTIPPIIYLFVSVYTGGRLLQVTCECQWGRYGRWPAHGGCLNYCRWPVEGDEGIAAGDLWVAVGKFLQETWGLGNSCGCPEDWGIPSGDLRMAMGEWRQETWGLGNECRRPEDWGITAEDLKIGELLQVTQGLGNYHRKPEDWGMTAGDLWMSMGGWLQETRG